MKNYKIILRNVGLVLGIVGLLDIGVMIYCIANQISYSSSFNVFAVIAGVFLIKGNLKAARIIAQFAAFFLAGFAVVLVVAPFIVPFDLIQTYFTLEPAFAAFASILIAVFLAMLVWVYRELTSPPVLTALDEAKIDYTSFWRKPVRGFLFGGCLVILLFVLLSLLMSGETADQVKQRAAVQVGPTYKLFVNSISMSANSNGKYVNAAVTAYNDKEIKNITIEWQE